jgi:hypothetical protein
MRSSRHDVMRVNVSSSSQSMSARSEASVDRVHWRELLTHDPLTLTNRQDVESRGSLIPRHQNRRLVRGDKYGEAQSDQALG